MMRTVVGWLINSPWWFWAAGLALAVFVRLIGPVGDVVDVAALVFASVFFVGVTFVAARWLIRSLKARAWAKSLLAILLLLAIGRFWVHVLFPSEVLRVETAVEAAMTSEDPSYCSEYVTEHFMQQEAKAPAPFADDLCRSYADFARAESVEIGDIGVDGEHATAIVTVDGGRLDGQCIELELVKEGDDWKVDRVVRFVRFDRNAYENAWRTQFTEFGSPPSAGDCAVARIRGNTNSELQQLSLSTRPGDASRIAAECDRTGLQRSLLAGFQGPEYEDLPRELLACIEAKVRSASNAELARLATDEVAYGSLAFECDRAATLEYLRHELEGEDDVDPQAAGCVVSDLAGRPPAGIIRLTYDGAAYEALIDRCKD